MGAAVTGKHSICLSRLLNELYELSSVEPVTPAHDPASGVRGGRKAGTIASVGDPRNILGNIADAPARPLHKVQCSFEGLVGPTVGIAIPSAAIQQFR